MAEEGGACELEGLERQLQSLSSRYTSDELRVDSKSFCSDFRELVEEYASRWQVPLPQLRILEVALRCFTRASTFFTSNCDHVLHTLSSLALSLFELLLFFDQEDLHQEPLKHFTVTFQECHLALARHQNVHLLQVERLVRGGGLWACPALQAILSESSLPQSEVDECISSELPVFFELRVRYLLSCERVSEAMALAKCCAWHPTAGQHLFFLQVYLTWLFKTSQSDSLQKELADFDGKDAIHIICSLECEEKDELLLSLSRAFLSQQLRKGDMYYLCDLVFIWSKLHSRLKTSKQALLEESHQLMLSATNVNSIFPFIRAILQELGEDGIQFCVELCANALESCLPCDVITKSLIYKTIAGMLPNDLEVCRACALLVFFLERTVEAYKMVYLLYMHPDQEYHVEYSPIRNHIRFETLQVLKKDLYFDPEFWNLIALRTNCLKLMSEKVVSAALEEIMEDKWILNYCTKETALRSSTSGCQKGSKGARQAAAKKRHHKEDTDTASKRLKFGSGKTQLNVGHAVKKKGNQGSRPLKDASSEPLRRSFWQLDRLRDNVTVGYGELRRTTRLSEKNPPKRRIQKPKWLLEDSGVLGQNNVSAKIKKHGLKHQKQHRSPVEKTSETGQIKDNGKHKPSVNSHLSERENDSKRQKGYSLDSKPAAPPQVILELSLPDNELMGTFIEDTCNRQRGFPQVLLYKPTVKLPATSQLVKTVHRKEVVLRARDAAMFVQQLHCYTRRQKGKGSGLNIQGSVSTITRSSVQGSPPKELCEQPSAEMKGGIVSQTPREVLHAQSTKAVSRKTPSARELSGKAAVEMKVTVASQTLAATKATESPVLDKVPQAESTGKVLQALASTRGLAERSTEDKVLQNQTRELCEESAVEMKVTFASQTPTAGKVSKVQTVKDASKTTSSAEVSQISTVVKNQIVVTEDVPPVSTTANMSIMGADSMPSQSQDVLRDEKQLELKSLPSQVETGASLVLTDVSPKGQVPCENGTGPGETMTSTYTSTGPDSVNDMSALTLVTEVVTELAPERLVHKQAAPEDSVSKESRAGRKPKAPHKLLPTSSCFVPESAADVQGKREGSTEIAPETAENCEPVESEESKLEYCCTFCNKVFKGSRVVAHAMFHYRKDECMFCGTMFKDDLLAMMHLSDHIEKLKRIKESAGNNAQENWVSETKDISTPKSSAKAKTANMSSGRRISGRPRKSDVCQKSFSLPDSTPSGSRNLRSNDKPVEGPPIQEKNQNTSKHLHGKTPAHKVNGHTGKKKELDRLKKNTLNSEANQLRTQQQTSQERGRDGADNSRLHKNQDLEMGSTSSVQVDKKFSCTTGGKMKEKESLHVLKTATKQDVKVGEEKNVELQEKVCCPVDGCTWFTDLAKNRVALLYHALDDHYGEVKPLELAFRIGSSKCSICMRVMWSFEHFQHHVERHRVTPRHPCLHRGCSARFKTGMEMRRHARRHSPLQAVCCLPGCSQLFICLWALNLHEREHYASKSTKQDKDSNEQIHDKRTNTPAGKKQPNHHQKDEMATAVSSKAARKSRGQATDNSSDKHVKAPSPTTVGASLLKGSSETKDSHVLKNLSNKNTSAQPSGPNLRLRQTLRNIKVRNTPLAPLKSQKVISSSLFKHSIKVRHKLKKRQVKVNTKGPQRRGRPPKSKKAVHDENVTTGPNNDTVKEKTDQRSQVQLSNPSKATETPNVSKEMKQEKSQQIQDVVKTTEKPISESKSKKSINKQIKKNDVKQKGGSHSSTTSNVTTDSSKQKTKTHKLSSVEMKKRHKAKKRAAPKENASVDPSESKKHKIKDDKANTEIKKKCPIKEPESASEQPAKSNSVVPQVGAKAAAAATIESSADEEGKAKAENTDSTQNGSAITADSSNEMTEPPTTSGEKTQKVAMEKKSKKSHVVKKEGKKDKNTHTTPDSGKKNKKHKDTNKTGDISTAKNASKTSALKKRTKSKEVEAKAAAVVQSPPDVEGKAKEETSNAPLDSSCSAVPAATTGGLNDSASSPTATRENVPKVTTKEKSKKSSDAKNSDPNKASKKRKVKKEGDAKTVKKQCKDQGVSKQPAKSKTEVQPEVVESSECEAGNTLAESHQSKINSLGYSLIMNGQAATEDVKSTVCKDALAEYGKKPYMRPPPTAYLDEKYITMPKRRKEVSFLPSTQRSPPPEQPAVTTPLQRQRCANCFATFNSAEDLQSHLQLQRCSDLFGFDSDDEGNS